MGCKIRMSTNDHEAIGRELKIAQEALQNVVLITSRRCVRKGELRGTFSLMSAIIASLREIQFADCGLVDGPQRGKSHP